MTKQKDETDQLKKDISQENRIMKMLIPGYINVPKNYLKREYIEVLEPRIQMNKNEGLKCTEIELMRKNQVPYLRMQWKH